ncbi:MAG: hypothetical protein ACRD0O_03860 [Acidimicrobiia bacterium]
MIGLVSITSVPAGTEPRVVALAVSHLRPCTLEHAPVILRGRVIHTGPNFTLAEATVEDGLGRSVAHATAQLLVEPVQPPPPSRAYRWLGEAEPNYPTPDPYLRPLAPSVGLPPAEAFTQMPGLASVRGAMTGELPIQPIWALLGIRNEEADEGSSVHAMRAVQCARAIRDGVARLGIEIRAGLHSGECDVVGSDLGGIAVHVASRVSKATGTSSPSRTEARHP